MPRLQRELDGRTRTFRGRPRAFWRSTRAQPSEPQATAKCGAQPVQLGLCVPPGSPGLGKLLLQAVGPAVGTVQAGLKTVGQAAGLLQPPGDAVHVGPQGLLGLPALAEAPLQLLRPGLSCGLCLCQLPLQPSHL